MSAADLPDFLLIGAMKCGTTTLAAQLARQPGLFMTTPKEPNFFSDDAVFGQGLDWYRGLFAAAPPGALKGEASTHYTKLPTHPETLARLQAVLPAPRLVYMIRDPVERAISHYIHDWSKGGITASSARDLAATFDAHPELVEYGCYGRQIAPFLSAFGPGSVLLTSLEAMTEDPGAVLAEVCRFIGFSGLPAWDESLGAQNVSAARYRTLPFRRLLLSNPLMRGLRRTLVPKALRDRVRQARSLEDRPALPEALRARLAARFAEDHALLAGFFPGHPALERCYPFLSRQGGINPRRAAASGSRPS